MLDARYVAEHLEEVRSAMARRSASDAAALDGLSELVQQRRGLIQRSEALKAEPR